MKDLRQPVERVMWETVRADMKYPIEDNNNGFEYGLNLYDDSMGLDEEGNEQYQDIIDVQWFETDQEREDFIKENDLRVIFE